MDTKPFEFSSRKYDDVVILDCKKSITLMEGLTPLMSALKKLFEQGNKFLVLDLVVTERVDIQGIRKLLEYREEIRRKGGELKLVRPNLEIKQKFENFGIKSCATRKEVVASFKLIEVQNT